MKLDFATESATRLKEQAQSIKNEKKEEESQRVSFFELYRFAEPYDYLLLALGVIFALIAGCSFPWFAYLWGKILDSFLKSRSAQERVDNAEHFRNIFFYVGVGALFASWIAFACWTIVSERMGIKCRKQYFKSLMRQDVGWYDKTNQYELSSQFSSDALAYQKATGQKIGSMFNIFAMFACGAAIAFAVRWTMTLVIFACMPIIAVTAIVFIYWIHLKNTTFRAEYQKADGCAQQALTSIKTVKSLNGQLYQFNKYVKFLHILKEKVLKYSLLAGIGTGLFFFIQYCAFSYGFWYGTHCVGGSYRCPISTTGSVYTPGEQTIVFFGLFVGSFNFMQLVPNILAILSGMEAAKRLYAIIDKKPEIIKNESGLKPTKVEGSIKFDNVSFAYPADKSRKVLKNVSFQIQKGKINAFAGETGCGKSTIIQLVMRFYDPEEGRITLDGVDIKDLNLEWLRNTIGYVGQEPVLFEGTVKENILVGKQSASEAEITTALKKAQAFDFVMQLPGALEYDVGYGGSHLSGGQKQRIAIARALLRNPSILILDEATSALDRRNEKLIQKTLDSLQNLKLTTLTIAHRVKTIMNADIIYVLQQGRLIQKGKFKDLKRFSDYEIEKQDENVVIASNGKEQIEEVQELQKKKSLKIQEEESQRYEGSVYGRLFGYTEGNRCLFFFAVLMCIIAGLVHPGSSILLANNLNKQFDIYANSQFDVNNPQVAADISSAEDYILGLFLLAIFVFFPFMIQSVIFTKVGEEITEKLRIEVYNKLLRLPLSWFERSQNRGGVAATRFGVDSRQVNSLATSLVSTLIMNFASIIGGIVLALVFQWRIGLIGLIAMPLMVTSGFISMLFYGGFSDESDKLYTKSNKITEQAILNIRTVYSCGYEHQLVRAFDNRLQAPLDYAFWKGTKLGVLYGMSQLILLFVFGVLFYFGAVILRDNQNVTLLDILISIMAITWAGWYAGNNFYFMPDLVAGKRSAENLFAILDSLDEDQIQINQNSSLKKTNIEGNINFKDVTFKYGSSQSLVLNKINLHIKKGQKIAFVGPSGCGKSTMIQLLQRFYDYEGKIEIDGIDMKQYDLYHLRSFFSAVSQEPNLFSGTFKQNIQYNVDNATDQEIEKAAKKACAINFILDSNSNQNEQGFEREVGVKGARLSGGQKQRIAIARALIRQYKILLFDEATSALDRETEKEVQKNMDQEMSGKTSINVAHRIQTIKNSDKICVFDRGEILEEGTYEELMRKKKYFYQLERGEKISE